MKRFADLNGFTLIELMIVVLIIALVLSVSYPVLSRGSASLEMRSGSRDVLNSIRYAREQAITQATGARIVVERQSATLTLTDPYGEHPHTYRLPRSVQFGRLVVGGAAVDHGPMVVRFLSNGSSDAAEISLVSTNGSERRIVTDPLTGGARILDPREKDLR